MALTQHLALFEAEKTPILSNESQKEQLAFTIDQTAQDLLKCPALYQECEAALKELQVFTMYDNMVDASVASKIKDYNTLIPTCNADALSILVDRIKSDVIFYQQKLHQELQMAVAVGMNLTENEKTIVAEHSEVSQIDKSVADVQMHLVAKLRATCLELLEEIKDTGELPFNDYLDTEMNAFYDGKQMAIGITTNLNDLFDEQNALMALRDSLAPQEIQKALLRLESYKEIEAYADQACEIEEALYNIPIPLRGTKNQNELLHELPALTSNNSPNAQDTTEKFKSMKARNEEQRAESARQTPAFSDTYSAESDPDNLDRKSISSPYSG